MHDERIERNASYFAQTLRRGAQEADFATRQVPGLTWSVLDLARHVVGITDFYAELIAAPTPTPWPADFDQYTADGLAKIEQTDLFALADVIVPNTLRFLDALGEDRSRLVNFWIRRRPVEMLLGLWLEELIVHRHDLARAMGETGEIDPADARRVLDPLLEFGLDFVDPDVVAQTEGTIALQVRGGDCYAMRIADGVVAVTKEVPKRPDWRLSVDPVAFLLVSMGRQGLARPSLTGKLIGWGRDPRLGLALNRLFIVP